MLHFIYLFITCTNNLEDVSLKTTTTMGYVMVLTNLRKTDFRLEYLFEIGRASRQRGLGTDPAYEYHYFSKMSSMSGFSLLVKQQVRNTRTTPGFCRREPTDTAPSHKATRLARNSGQNPKRRKAVRRRF